jgi:ribosomal protein S18 acetylase RimI-like enzyme
MTQPRQGFIAKTRLSGLDIAELRELAVICNAHDSALYRANWETLEQRESNTYTDFCYYQDNRLMGMVSLYMFQGEEAEISGLVHPDIRRQGIGTALLQAAAQQAALLGAQALVLFHDVRSEAGSAFIKALQPKYSHNEYRLDLVTLNPPEHYTPGLVIAPAQRSEALDVAVITAEAFGMNAQQIVRSIEGKIATRPNAYYLARLNGQPIGALSVTISGLEAGIYGVGIISQLRGKGYGRELIAKTILDIQAQSPYSIYIEVEPENTRARRLYEYLGFQFTTEYHYSRLELQGA